MARGTRFHAALGNHDVYECTTAAYRPLPPNRDAYRWRAAGCEVDEHLAHERLRLREPAALLRGRHRRGRGAAGGGVRPRLEHPGHRGDAAAAGGARHRAGGVAGPHARRLPRPLEGGGHAPPAALAHRQQQLPGPGRRPHPRGAPRQPAQGDPGPPPTWTSSSRGTTTSTRACSPRTASATSSPAAAAGASTATPPQPGYVAQGGVFLHYVYTRITDDRFEYYTIDSRGRARDGGWWSKGDARDHLFPPGTFPPRRPLRREHRERREQRKTGIARSSSSVSAISRSLVIREAVSAGDGVGRGEA